MKKSFVLLLFLVSTASSLLVVKPVYSSLPKPSVPEFTVKLVDSSYDIPTSYSIEPYTGENVTHTGYHVESRSIEVTITNQPFVPYYDDNSGWDIEFYYNIRIKGSYSEDWIELYRASDGYSTPSDSQFTIFSYVLGENTDTVLGTKMIEFPDDAQVDFQVQAMIGYVHRVIDGAMAPWIFTGETSGWSETKTLTISASDSTTPDTSPPQNSTESTEQSNSQNVDSLGLDWVQFATLTLLGVIVVLLVIMIAYLHKSIKQTESNQCSGN